jgi:hypothetical protein
MVCYRQREREINLSEHTVHHTLKRNATTVTNREELSEQPYAVREELSEQQSIERNYLNTVL